MKNKGKSKLEIENIRLENLYFILNEYIEFHLDDEDYEDDIKLSKDLLNQINKINNKYKKLLTSNPTGTAVENK